ncbi:YqaA family protein [Methanolobus sp. ZRKC2]|uniref:YqaA family protein n=1 Tax=Methanolobus sp. ZRKC2 TaxID=3125783 RepID=UPI003247E85E
MLENLLITLSDYAYLSLFVASFLASTILPLGSETLVVILIRSGFDFLAVVMVATFGNYLGACTTYYIGFKGRSDVIEKYFSISKEQLEKADKWFGSYGPFLLLFTWLPFIGDVITASGGILKLDFKIFSIYVFLGKFLRYIAISYIALNL